MAADFHKLLWQPAGCGAFLVRDRALLAPLEVTVPTSTPTPAGYPLEEWRMPHLVGRSLATTRRFAALGPAPLSRRSAGRAIGELVDRTLELAAAPPRRSRPSRPWADRLLRARVGGVPLHPVARRPGRSDRVNEATWLHLLAAGQAVVGRTEVAGRTHLCSPC